MSRVLISFAMRRPVRVSTQRSSRSSTKPSRTSPSARLTHSLTKQSNSSSNARVAGIESGCCLDRGSIVDVRYNDLEFSHSTSADRPHWSERHNQTLGNYLGASTEGCVDIHARVRPNSKPHSWRGQQMKVPHRPQHIYQPGRRRQGACPGYRDVPGSTVSAYAEICGGSCRSNSVRQDRHSSTVSPAVP